MATDDFQANWRGARRYQFDEEARRKREASIAKQSRQSAAGHERSNVEVFRQIKHGEPERFAVLAEDLAPKETRHKHEPLVAKQSPENADGREHGDVGVNQIEHGGPETFEVLAENLLPKRRSVTPFAALVTALAVIAFGLTFAMI